MTEQEVLDFVEENDVKFIRLAFVDLYGTLKNISIMPTQLHRALSGSVSFDASAVKGFCDISHSELFLRPDPKTITLLPWRPQTGRVARMMCDCLLPDGTLFTGYSRSILRQQVEKAKSLGLTFQIGTEYEFYLFQSDDAGEVTLHPQDCAGYMDVSPLDKGENVRREICLTLEQMGIRPECSHHEQGPGQNEIDFRYAEPVKAADDAVTFRTVVNTVALRNGLAADFSPKPLRSEPGNGMHINLSARSSTGEDIMPQVIAGILSHISDMTAFLNTTPASYQRFGSYKAPRYISWSSENRSQLIRIPAAEGEYRRAELRSPDPICNPYIAYTLLIYAGLDGIRRRAELPASADINFYTASEEVRSQYKTLPATLADAKAAAKTSEFIASSLPRTVVEYYTK